MADAEGGDGGRAARFAALASQLPAPLAVDAAALLEALTPCVAAYDASEEGQQPLVRAPGARARRGRQRTHWLP